ASLAGRLLARAPAGSAQRRDVGCGVGATTRHLLTHYPADSVSAIDISEKNLETARANAPGVTFRRMDATRLDFPDGAFDTVICVAAAFHVKPRRRFHLVASRVLTPRGSLTQA